MLNISSPKEDEKPGNLKQQTSRTHPLSAPGFSLTKWAKELSWTTRYLVETRDLKSYHICVIFCCFILGVFAWVGIAVSLGLMARQWPDRVGLAASVALGTLSLALVVSISLSVKPRLYLFPLVFVVVALYFIITCANNFSNQLWLNWLITSGLSIPMGLFIVEPILFIMLFLRPLWFPFACVHSLLMKTILKKCYTGIRARFQAADIKPMDSVHISPQKLTIRIPSSNEVRQTGPIHHEFPLKKWFLRILREKSWTRYLLEGFPGALLLQMALTFILGVIVCVGLLLLHTGRVSQIGFISVLIYAVLGVVGSALVCLGIVLLTYALKWILLPAPPKVKPHGSTNHSTGHEAPNPRFVPGVGLLFQLLSGLYMAGGLAVAAWVGQSFELQGAVIWSECVALGIGLTILCIEPILVFFVLLDIVLLPFRLFLVALWFMLSDLPEHMDQQPFFKRVLQYSVMTKYFRKRLNVLTFSTLVLGIITALLGASPWIAKLVSTETVLQRFIAGVFSAFIAFGATLVLGLTLVNQGYVYLLFHFGVSLFFFVIAMLNIHTQKQAVIIWLEVLGFSAATEIYMCELRMFTFFFLELLWMIFKPVLKRLGYSTKAYPREKPNTSPQELLKTDFEKRKSCFEEEKSTDKLLKTPSPDHSRVTTSEISENKPEDPRDPYFQECPWCKELKLLEELGAHLELCTAFKLCPWCKDKQALSTYDVHVEECDFRESQCEDCDVKMPFCLMERHKQECPKRTVTCDSCGQSLKIFLLSSHKRKLCPFRLVKCVQCSEEVPFNTLVQHMKEVCEYRPIQCPDCSEEVFVNDLSSHRTNECRRRNVTCNVCGEEIQFDRALNHRLCECSKRMLKCLRCELPVIANMLSYHNTELCAMRPVVCPTCKKAVPFKNLDIHQEKNCPLSPVPCEICGENIPKMHLKIHQEMECQQRCVNCSKCENPVRLSLCEQHDNSECPQRLVECNGCHESVRASFLEYHISNDCAERLVPCPKHCGEMLQASAVSEHILEACAEATYTCKCGCEVFIQRRREHLLECATYKQIWTLVVLKLFQKTSPMDLTQNLKQIKSLTKTAPEIGLLALAESDGNVSSAVQKLCSGNTKYKDELACAAIACNAKQFVGKSHKSKEDQV